MDSKDNTEELVRLSFFMEISKSIASCRTLDETLHEVMNQIGSIFAPLNWSLLLVDQKTGDLAFTIAEGKAASKLIGKTVRKGQGIAGWIAEKGVPLIVEDTDRDHRFDRSFDEETEFKTKSIIGVPLVSRGKVFGVIELVNKLEGSCFTPMDLKLLATIADFAAIAIEKVYYYESIKELLNLDHLTGVYNRRYLQFYLTKAIERIKRDKSPLSLLFVDIDDFKRINDTYGHVTGDEVLKLVADILLKTARSADLVFRFGGDEFIVLLPGTSSSKAEKLKDRITEILDRENTITDNPITLSIGFYEAKGEDYNELLNFVDQEMYLQKLFRKEKESMEVAENIKDHFER